MSTCGAMVTIPGFEHASATGCCLEAEHLKRGGKHHEDARGYAWINPDDVVTPQEALRLAESLERVRAAEAAGTPDPFQVHRARGQAYGPGMPNGDPLHDGVIHLALAVSELRQRERALRQAELSGIAEAVDIVQRDVHAQHADLQDQLIDLLAVVLHEKRTLSRLEDRLTTRLLALGDKNDAP